MKREPDPCDDGPGTALLYLAIFLCAILILILIRAHW
jgi:hypothetical protein